MDLRPMYGIDVGTFKDSNGDGIGDLRGLTESLDYVERLGVGWIWLLPFYPSPNRDNGYDVANYVAVDERLGDLDDFAQLVSEARRRGLNVLVDLVVNHTSDEHPWFQRARAAPDSPYRDYYTWRDAPPPPDEQTRPIFPDRVASTWTKDDRAGAFYFHQFYPFQPSLNHRNPAVRDEIRRIMEFWMELGVRGFRIDAAGHLGEPDLDPSSSEMLEIIRTYRSWARDGVVLLGEADLEPEALRPMLGPDRFQLLFDFIGNGHAYLAFVTESAGPLVRAFRKHGPAPDGSAWVHFLRNLDEVDLERIGDEERALVMERLAPDPRMRIFERGIRRRLAPMLDGNDQRIRLAFSILLAQPGLPMLVYGDEIGMGDDQDLPEREAVRTAMQWKGDDGAGFSTAGRHRRRVPFIARGPYRAEKVNVADQEADAGSLLAFVRRAIAVREGHIGSADGTELRAVSDERVFATCSSTGGGTRVTLANLSSRPATVERFWRAGRTTVVLGEAADASDDGPIRLGPYGFCWLEVSHE